MTKINKEEYEVLKELDGKWKWIARDEDGSLGVYDAKVVKTKFHNYWIMAIKKKIDASLFSFIQWEDEKPYNIQGLIDEYLDDEYGYFNMKLSREFEEFIKRKRGNRSEERY